MDDKFSLNKYVMSFFQWMPWVKTLRHLTGIILIVCLVGFIYMKFFKKDASQETTFQGDVGEVNIIQKNKRMFIPFVEGSAGMESNEDDMIFGIRTGLRFEF